MRIPAADLRAQNQALRDELVDAFRRVLDSSAFINGEDVAAFEGEFAAFCEVPHAIGVANGTDALSLALRALEIGPGDAVAVPAFTFAATGEAVCHVGARPVFVDIDRRTGNIDPQSLRETLQSTAVRAVIPVHLYGQPAPMRDVLDIAQQHGAAVIEDAAQAHGARYHGRRAGSLGALACFSFYPTKNLGALGDAGAITTSDAFLAERLRALRDHGQSRKYEHATIGFNSRLDSIQAAALRIKLRHLDAWNARRREIARHYVEAMHGLRGITPLAQSPDCEAVYHLFIVRCAERDDLRRYLEERGIATTIHYPFPLHVQPAFAPAGCSAGTMPAAEELAQQVVALPMYPELSDTAVDGVCAAVRDWTVRKA
ncbi:MAG TPA: DegT/DnrJ/EryC1/StrS family aminotransferase [Candidatus Acidoferrales bacterium]|nr:DegT/DnrJ/EryC1/StrS family aminotransferase [Candidatus Acidoferrales bacterium]